MATHSIPIPTPRVPRLTRHVSPSVALFAGGLVAFVLVAGIAVDYALTHRPITDLPGVEQVTKPIPPRRLFSFAGVVEPIGVAVSPDGQRIFVAEGGGEKQIKVFDRDGKPVAQLAPPGSVPGTRGPGPLAVDPQGRLYVAERMRGEVQTYGPSLEWEGGFRPQALDELQGWAPSGISVGPDGRIYITDIGGPEHQVIVLNADGTLADRFSANSGIPGGLKYPVQAVADEDGRVYVSDGNNARVLAISPRGVQAFATTGDEAITLPRGLTVSGGKLFVADAAGNRIAVFATGDRPQFLYAFGDGNGRDGLSYPNGVAVDQTGRVYVADRANSRVQVWTY